MILYAQRVSDSKATREVKYEVADQDSIDAIYYKHKSDSLTLTSK